MEISETVFDRHNNVVETSSILEPQSSFTVFISTLGHTQHINNEATYIESTIEQKAILLSHTVASAFSTIMTTSTSIVSAGVPDMVANPTEDDVSMWGNATNFLLNLTSLWKPAYIPKDLWVHPHWYQFPKQTELMHFIFGLSICFLGILSVIGNFLVMWIFGGTKGLRTPSNIFVINLAFSDFMMMATNFPVYVYNSYYQHWALGSFICEIYGFCGAFFGTLSIVTMAVISIDRYYVIVKPFVVMRKMNHTKATFIVAGVWIYVLAWCLPPFFGWNAYVPEGFLTTCSFDSLSDGFYNKAFVFGLFLGAYALPLSIILYCYFYIFKEVAKHEAEFKRKAKEMNVASLRGNEEFMKKRREIKTAKIAFSIIFLWIFAWTPYAVVALMGVFTDHSKITPLVSNLPAVFAKTAAVYNPIVYAISHPKFRSALRKKLPWLTCIPIEEPKGATDQSSASISRQSSIVSNLDSVRGDSVAELARREPEDKKGKGKSQDDDVTHHGSQVVETHGNIEMKTIAKKSSPSLPSEKETCVDTGDVESSSKETTDKKEKDQEPPKNVISVPGVSNPGTLQDNIIKEIIQNNTQSDICNNISSKDTEIEVKNLIQIEDKIKDSPNSHNVQQQSNDISLKISLDKENIHSLPLINSLQNSPPSSFDVNHEDILQTKLQLNNLLIPPNFATYMKYFDPIAEEITTISNVSVQLNQSYKMKFLKRSSVPNPIQNYFNTFPNFNEGKCKWSTQSYPGNSKYKKNLQQLLHTSQPLLSEINKASNISNN
uniref:Onychopsin n=1 Tax=Epiperipatus cf. isthmicola LH-2012 TaxID=1200982 RepID=I6SGT1_9BILA